MSVEIEMNLYLKLDKNDSKYKNLKNTSGERVLIILWHILYSEMLYEASVTKCVIFMPEDNQ